MSEFPILPATDLSALNNISRNSVPIDPGGSTVATVESDLFNDYINKSVLNVSTMNTSTENTMHLEAQICLGLFLGLFSITAMCGNILVMVAVVRKRYLRTATNYFIVSLAVADLMVGALVMPFAAFLEITRYRWLFGSVLCDLWHSFDVLASTASILNLCAISLDRYWAVTDPIGYPKKMSKTRIKISITLVWICSGLISFPAIAWWAKVTPKDLPSTTCVFPDDPVYIILSSAVSFYIPLFIMLFVYMRIYSAASAHSKSLRVGYKTMGRQARGSMLVLRIHRGGATSTLHSEATNGKTGGYQSICKCSLTSNDSQSDTSSPKKTCAACNRNSSQKRRKKSGRFAREQKAAKTLAIVMGIFVMCWLPFFVTNVLIALCPKCVYHGDIIFAIFTWLGYVNSVVNPVIYAVQMRDFRRAFEQLLCCGCKSRLRVTKSSKTRSASIASTSNGAPHHAYRVNKKISTEETFIDEESEFVPLQMIQESNG